MDKINLVKLLIAFLIVTLSILGLNSSVYRCCTRKFYTHLLLVFWCVAVALTFSLVYTNRLYNEIVSEGLDLTNAVKLYYCMNIIGAALNYFSQLLYSKAAVDLFNRIELFETIKYFDIEVKEVKSTVLLVTLKTIVFPVLIEITLILKQLHDDTDGQRSLLLTIYVLYPLVTANILPNCLFGVFVICKQLIFNLNRNLNSLEKEANFMQIREEMKLQKQYYRMQKFCNLADKLDELSEKYSLICSQTLDYMSLYAIPLLVSLLCNLLGITGGLFRQYYALADTIINAESYDAFNAVTNGVFLIISFLEIALLSLVGNQTITAAKETGLILKRIKLDNADIRFRQTVENFSFKIVVTNFKIQPMKLLNVDLKLLHNVISAVTSFLIILIQTDLTLRFSVK